MLEKIGLPARPSMRGASWVVDASHCQGCSAQFSFLTRKHHCQRCGGLFCSSCTQQRMVLRGQGDSPVRICDPCKKLEEAARFELRHGHKNRAAKANLRAASKPEDEVLSEILGGSGKQPQLSQREPLDSALPNSRRTESTASASSSSSRRTSASFDMDGNEDRSVSVEAHSYELNNIASIFSPEELRQQAAEEKKRYKSLRSEGKPEEALRAFKHGKELERQAAALEIELRKSRKMALKAPHVTTVVNTQKIDDSEEAETKKALAGRRVKKEKNDLASELRELGWSDADIHDETRTAGLSVEGELSQLLKEAAPKSSECKKTGGIDKSQVNAIKRQALLLKREGRLAEAKEELKKAKILEKQLEEQEILGEAEESDEDLAAIIHDMDNDNQDDLLLPDNPGFPAFNFEQILGASDNLAIDGNFDTTDDDMNDPEMADTLKSFGWSEEDDRQAESHGLPTPLNQEALKEQVLTLKREAVTQKRAGNVAEAMSLLKKAKLLEKDLETEELGLKVLSPEEQNTQAEDGAIAGINSRAVSAPKSKLAIQRELLALKKRALALRREGKVDEAQEELKKGNVLEEQLQELENSSKRPVAKESMSFESTTPYKSAPPIPDITDDGYEPEVTDSDMQDPALLSVLKNMGWEDVDTGSANRTDEPSNPPPVVAWKPMKSKGQIQKELLAIKRKALVLRREGKNAEAEEELEKAKILEQQITEIEELGNSNATQQDASGFEHLARNNKSDVQHAISINADIDPSSLRNSTKEEVLPPQHAAELGASMSTLTRPLTTQRETVISKPGHAARESDSGMYSVLSQSTKSSAFTDPLGTGKGSRSSPDALAHKESQPRVPVKQQENAGDKSILPSVLPSIQMAEEKQAMSKSESTAGPEEELSHGDDSLKNEILLHKRKAVALKREGMLAEAREELKLAKLLEKRLEGSEQISVDGGDGSPSTFTMQQNNLNQPAGVSNADAMASAPPVPENKSSQPHKAMSSRDRLKIQRESLAHKRNALKLRREGKTAEADAEFELAKSLESQLEDSDNQGSSNSRGKPNEANDAVVEDLLDPQIMSALKSIGWSDMDFLTQPSNTPHPNKAEAKSTITVTSKPQNESKLEEQIKAEKLKALNFKREGKQAEALDALRSAKRLERKLGSHS